MDARPPFDFVYSESTSETLLPHHSYMTFFQDHKVGIGTVINPRTIMRMGRADVPWSDLGFKSKSQSHQSFNKWIKKILSDFEVSGTLSRIGMEKAINLA